MSWLYSQVLVEEYLGENSLDGEQSVQLSGNPTPQAYLSPDKMTDFSRLSRFGMTFKPLTESRGEELLTLFQAGFPVKTSQPLEKEQGLTENDQECGATWQGSLAKYDPDTSLWRTAQCSLLEDLNESLATLPCSGMTRNGLLWELPMLEQTISETEYGSKRIYPTPTASAMPCEGPVRRMRNAWLEGMSLEEASAIAGRDVRMAQGKVPNWPTPVRLESNGSAAFKLTDAVEASLGKTMPKMQKNPQMWEMFKNWPSPNARDWKDSGASQGNRKSPNLGTQVHWPTPRTAGMCGGSGSWDLLNKNTTVEEARQMGAGNGGKLNPTWVEWLMGWPLGWTDLKPLGTGKCHSAPPQHGEL